MNLISYGELQLFYCPEILNEYKKVLAYERLSIPVQAQNKAIEGINKLGMLVEPVASTLSLRDETDRIFYDTARTIGAILITGNIKHFPAESFIMSPTAFLEELALQ